MSYFDLADQDEMARQLGSELGIISDSSKRLSRKEKDQIEEAFHRQEFLKFLKKPGPQR